MSIRRVESVLERTIDASPAGHYLDAHRTVRILEFLGVGAIGAGLDLALTFALLNYIHYLGANAAGFLLAVSFNFAGNWWLTFDQPSGSLWWQYSSYVGLHGTTFAIRAIAIAVLIEGVGVPAAVATVIGVGVAAIGNYLGTEQIFDGDGRYWLDAVEAANQVAHAVYSSRLRAMLRTVGLYDPLYRTYQVALGCLYRSPTRTIHAGGVSGTVYTERGAEVVSVFHTLEKEQAILDRFVSELQSDDCVWDVGANLGVFSVLAGAVTTQGAVVAFEPVPATAVRCRENLELSGLADRSTVRALALGANSDTVALTIDRDELGTQTPRVSPGGDLTVSQQRGDAVADVPPPTVLKIDVEGHEAAVLDGCAGLLDSVRLVYVETHDGEVHCSDENAVRDLLAGHGFTVETIEAGQQTYLRAVAA